MRNTIWLALSLTLLSTPTYAEPLKTEHIGDLICTVGRASPKAEMVCTFRNKNTGLEEAYQGSVINAGLGSLSSNRTMLWVVNARPNVQLKPGVLAQRYEAPESEQKSAKSVEGDDRPGVSLRLVTHKNDDLSALATLTIELKLVSTPT